MNCGCQEMLTMTSEARVDRLLNYPWTIRRESLVDGGIALRVAELPHFVVAGSEAEVASEFWDALRGYLDVAVKNGATLPDVEMSFTGMRLEMEGVVLEAPARSCRNRGRTASCPNVGSGAGRSVVVLDARWGQ